MPELASEGRRFGEQVASKHVKSGVVRAIDFVPARVAIQRMEDDVTQTSHATECHQEMIEPVPVAAGDSQPVLAKPGGPAVHAVFR